MTDEAWEFNDGLNMLLRPEMENAIEEKLWAVVCLLAKGYDLSHYFEWCEADEDESWD